MNILDRSKVSKAISKLYSVYSNFSNSSYQLISSDEHLDNLVQGKFHVCVHINNSTRYIVFFTNIDNTNYCLLIDRKYIKNFRNYVKDNEVQIYVLHEQNTNVDMFQNTVLDCRFYEQKQQIFVYDVFCLNDINMSRTNFAQKNSSLNVFISTIKSKLSLQIILAKFYKYNDLPKLVYDTIPSNNISYVNGLMFYPEFTGKYYIFINNKDFEKSELKYSHELSEKNRSRVARENKLFNMKQVGTPDVYELFDISSGLRIGIAHIPDMNSSRGFKMLFGNDKTKIIKVNCIYSVKFGLWVPIYDKMFEYTESIFMNDTVDLEK